MKFEQCFKNRTRYQTGDFKSIELGQNRNQAVDNFN